MEVCNKEFEPCKTCGKVPEVFVNVSYYDMITCRCDCEDEKDYPTVELAKSSWNSANRGGVR